MLRVPSSTSIAPGVLSMLYVRGQLRENNILSGVHAPLSDKRFRSSVVILQIDRAGLVNKISKGWTPCHQIVNENPDTVGQNCGQKHTICP